MHSVFCINGSFVEFTEVMAMLFDDYAMETSSETMKTVQIVD